MDKGSGKPLFVCHQRNHGKGAVLFKWDPQCKYLATCGQNRVVLIWARDGEVAGEFSLPGQRPCIALDWDHDGENLAALQDASAIVPIWNVNDKKVRNLDTNLRDPSWMAWSRVGPQLAVGTAKGNLLIYNHQTLKKIPLLGKHSKRITCGMWNLDNRLALASQDRMMTINDEAGNQLESAQLKLDPVDLQFAEQKQDEKSNGKETTVSVNQGNQTILMYNMNDGDNPVELAFQQKYGDIAAYRWYGDGYMLVGFSKGFVIAISTHMKEIGEELQSLKVHDTQLYDVVYSAQLHKLATAGDDGVKVVDLNDFKEIRAEHRQFPKEDGDAEKLEWTKDGQILTVATTQGSVYNFLMSTPTLAVSHHARLVYLSSLRSVTVKDYTNPDQPLSVEIPIAVEPSFVALGPTHVAIGMNTHAWFYSIEGDPMLIGEKDFVGTVKQILLNDAYVAVLCDGKVHLQALVLDDRIPEDREQRIFPEKGDDRVITCIGLTNDFLIYATSKGTLSHFYLQDWKQSTEFKHECGIVSIYPNLTGTRVVFVDNANRGFLYSPVDDHRVQIDKFPTSVDTVLWDPADSNTLVVVDAKVNHQLITYSYTPQTTRGPIISRIMQQTKVPYGFSTVLVYDGSVYGLKNPGGLASMSLASHDAINFKGRRSAEKLRQALQQLLALSRLKQAWEVACVVKAKDFWISLARKALEQMDVELAIRVYRELKDAAMVMALQDLLYIEDKPLLAGHICLLNGEYPKAQTLFLQSTQPMAALQMRRDLLNWDLALQLASNLAKEQLPAICREYAQQLESKGDYQQAVNMYQRALEEELALPLENREEKKKKAASKESKDSKDSKTLGGDAVDHQRVCNGGIARMTLRLGDIPKGRSLALDSNDKHLMKECGQILESMKQFGDAAEMYEKAESFEKAASIYIKTKNFARAGRLMEKITTPKLHAEYAKAKEAEKAYAEAAAAYEKARDLDSVVRLSLNHLDTPERAFAIVRQTRSAEGATMVAKYCVQTGNAKAAIEFLLMAMRPDEAFVLAQGHKEMEHYAKMLGDQGTTEDYLKIARYYEETKDFARAGDFYALCNDLGKAVKYYLECGESKLDEAIQLVEKAYGPGRPQGEGDFLRRQVESFLQGEVDGTPKDPKYALKLFVAVGDYPQAALTAISIAAEEQKEGKYGDAHDTLFHMNQSLVAHHVPIPADLRKNLLLVHSYILVKPVSNRDHRNAARLLIRVASNLSKFPKHTVAILTSCVVECMRGKLRRSALEWGQMVMRPEYRKQVRAEYYKKIEAIVRRPPEEEEDETQSPCPFCSESVPDWSLDCPHCHNNLPYCIVTGKHVVAEDLTQCPSCKFFAIHTDFLAFINAEKKCPMCKQEPVRESIVKIKNARGALLHEDTDGKERKEEKASSGGSQGNVLTEERSPANREAIAPPPRKNAFGAFGGPPQQQQQVTQVQGF